MNRKYSQRGYMDSERPAGNRDRDRPRSAPRANLTTEERIQKKSLRHAVDREANEILRCHNCGKNVPTFEEVTRESKCPHCAVALHCCRACTHFDSVARWQCRAAITRPVGDKNKANACPQHLSRRVLDVTGRRSSSRKPDNPRALFDDLFKN